MSWETVGKLNCTSNPEGRECVESELRLKGILRIGSMLKRDVVTGIESRQSKLEKRLSYHTEDTRASSIGCMIVVEEIVVRDALKCDASVSEKEATSCLHSNHAWPCKPRTASLILYSLGIQAKDSFIETDTSYVSAATSFLVIVSTAGPKTAQGTSLLFIT